MNSYSIFLLFSLLLVASNFNSIPVQAHSEISTSYDLGGLDFLIRTPSRRSLLSHHDDVDAKQDKTLFVSPDGTIYLVEQNSGELLFSLPTGPSISSLHRKSSPGGCWDKECSPLVDGETEHYLDDKYTLDIGGGLLHTEDSGEMNLMKIVEDYFSGAPYISKDEVSIGKTKLTVLVIDSSNGKVTALLDPNEVNNALSQKRTTDKEIVQPLFVKRSDYELLSFSLKSKKLLWNLTFSRIEASLIDQERESQVPVVHMRDATHVQFLLEISRLIHKGIKPFVATKSNEYSKYLIDAGNNVKDTTLVETSQNIISAEKGNLNSNENKISHHRKWKYIAVSWFLFIFIMWYTGIITITSQKSTIELSSTSGKNSSALKKKAGKLEKDNSGTNTKTVAKSTLHEDLDKFDTLESLNRNSQGPLSNLEIPVDADMDGRKIGKLFISNTEIGKGSNGTIVIEGIYDGRPVAVKRLLRVHHDIAYKEIQNLIVSDRHPNIVRWYGVEYDSDFVYLSLERCTCNLGDLIKTYANVSHDLVSRRGNRKFSTKEHSVQLDILKRIDKNVELWKANGYPSPRLLRLMRDIVSGLVHLHELGIVHRDLKPENVLIISERSLCAKLSDMGISKRLVENNSSLGDHPTGYGSSGWQAPEQLLHKRQTRAVDLFSLGCVLFFCITGGRHPFGEHLERDINIVKNRVNLFIVEHIPEAVDLFSHLLNSNPDLRPVASYVLHHPLFWSSETRLSFIRDASDRVELEDRESTSDLLKALENVGRVALGGYWDKKLETKIINNIGRYRRYKFDSSRDLLRVMRNKLNHYRELPKEIQEILGGVPEGFDNYFSSRFPNFFIGVYKVIYGYCREEECFQKYFKTV